MTISQALELLGAVAITIGPLGSLLEQFGTAVKWPKLVAIGQRLEAVGADLPKLWRGSRLTKEQAK